MTRKLALEFSDRYCLRVLYCFPSNLFLYNFIENKEYFTKMKNQNTCKINAFFFKYLIVQKTTKYQKQDRKDTYKN